MKPIRILSMRRSGTHFLKSMLNLNFKVMWSPLDLYHPPLPDIHGIKLVRYHSTPILTIRNPVFNLKSLYRYYIRVNKTQDSKYWFDLTGVSFTDFINGKTPHKESIWDRSIALSLRDPIQYWIDMSYYASDIPKEFPILGTTVWEKKIFTVRYEDLRDDHETVLENIHEHFGFERMKDEWMYQRKAVGPRGAGPKPVWNDKDLKMLEDKAGKRMSELGYKIEDGTNEFQGY